MPSAQVTITQLPAAGPITGTESVPIVQNGQTVQTTTGAIAASPSQQQTFITVTNQPTLPNSRSLSGSTGIGLVDGGPLGTLQITLNGVSGTLETLATGFVVKDGGTVVNRTLTTTANGIAIANANGAGGNPQFSLSGIVGTVNSLTGTGIIGITGGTNLTSVAITGTANQIDVANGTGPGNPTISITSNPTIPGTGAMIVPTGTSAQRPGGTNGQIRFNSDTAQYEVYQNGWVDLSTSAGTVDFYHNGSIVSSGDGLNFIDSANIDLTVVDDPFNGWVAVTPNLTTTGVVAASYGSQSNTLTATVDSFGRLSALAQTAIGNLPNAALQNSSVTFNGVTVALGASGTITSNTPNSLTINNGGAGAASGATFNGSSPVTISYNTIGAPSTSGANATGTWSISVTGNAGTSTSLSGGAAGSVPYQSGASTTTFLNIGTNGQVITSSGTAPQWVDQSTLSVGSATTSTNLAGGAAGSIPYQTGAGATTFLAQSSGVLVGGPTPSYSTAPSLTGTNFSSIPNGALQNSSITIGTTGINLGSTATTLAGLTSVSVTQAPSSALQLATKQYVDDQVASGIDIHTPVRVETPTALNATYTPGGTAVTVTDITGSKTLTFSTSPSLSINDQIVFSVTSNGITSGTAYYVYSAPAANQVTLSLSYNGPELTTLTNGTGLTITGTVNAGVGATLTNAGANAAIQIDGITLSATNRVLVYNQANAAHNGVYTVTTVGTPDPGGTPWVLTRATDANKYQPDSTTGLGQGDYFFVQEGNTGAGESYVLTTTNPLIIGTTNLTFTQFSASQVYSAGTGLTLTGTTFSLTSPVVTTLGGTGLTSYTAGDTLYYAAGTALSKLPIGASTTIMTSTGSAPQWSSASGITVGTASNIAGGAAGSLPYNTASGTTTFLGIGTATYLLTSSGTAPQWSDPSGVTVGTATNSVNSGITLTSTNSAFYPAFVGNTSGNEPIRVGSGLTFNPSTNTLTTTTFSGALSGNATTATTASNVAGGAAGSIVYQTGASTTTTLPLGTAGFFLTAGASAPQWTAAASLAVTSISFGTTGLTPTTATQGAVTVAGTLITSNGGTGLSSYTAGDLPYYATGTALSKLGIGASTTILTSTGSAPQWTTPSSITVGTATNANNVAVTASSTNASFYPGFFSATTGNLPVAVDADLTYNPSTNTLTAGTMVATTGIFGGTF